MRVLVTGSEGFLGKNLCNELKKREHHVYGVDLHIRLDPGWMIFYTQAWPGDITNFDFLRTVMKHLPRIDRIIHLAAQAIVGKAEASPYSCFQTNIMGTVNVLEAARKVDASVIVASSDKAYGESPPPYTEETELKPARSGPYSVSKACADIIARSYTHTYGLSVAVTRSSNIYGPGDLNFSRLIPYTIKCLIHGEIPKFHAGAGDICREYTYIDDVVDAYILLAEKIDGVKGEAFNVGSGFKATRDQVVKKIFELMDVEISPQLVPAEFKEIRSQYLTSEKIRGLGWQPKTSFEEGLKRTIEWYRRFLS